MGYEDLLSAERPGSPGAGPSDRDVPDMRPGKEIAGRVGPAGAIIVSPPRHVNWNGRTGPDAIR